MKYATSEDVIKLMQGISKKIPQGIMNGDTTVGHITWQMYLMKDYLKLDGTPLANASVDYKELLKFAQDNNLIIADTTDKSLFKYDSSTNVLTLPDYDTDKTVDLIPQIKYKKSTTIWETVDIGKFVATAPAHYEREQLFTTNKTIVTIYPTWVNIDGSGYVLNNQITININEATNWDDSQYATATNRAGKDFYIYACKPVSDYAPKFILSINSTVPAGYTANDSRKIGGFHCLCADVGTITDHTLSGYIAGDILPNSPWDLDFRAESENNGMVYIPQIGLWADIYLGSWDGLQIVSEYGGTPITGISSKPMHGIMLAEYYGLVNKFLPSYDEFIVCAKGSPEGDHINIGAMPSVTGGHIATGGKRIISNYGLEDCVGVVWQWGRDLNETSLVAGGNATTYRGAYYTNGNYLLDGLQWIDIPVYNSTVDTVRRGLCNGLLQRFVFGGFYGFATSTCGSRTVSQADFGTRSTGAHCGRGFARKR